MITCIKELNEPRYMSIGGIYEAYEKPMEVFDYNTLKDSPLIDVNNIGLCRFSDKHPDILHTAAEGAGQMLERAQTRKHVINWQECSLRNI